jgi:hypothetical protein
VTITVAGVGSTTTFGSGGYAIQLSPGTYTVTASGGGLPTPITASIQVGASNVRVNFTPQSAQLVPWLGLLYRDVLQRTGSAAEVAYWVGVLEEGASRQAVVLGFLGSREYQQNVVTQIYTQYLHRSPDAAGLAWWVNAMQAGLSEADVRQGILSSPEYFNEYGGTAAGFVKALYSDLLGRVAQQTEVDYWTGVLAVGDRAEVSAGFLHSAEFDADVIGGYYQTYLRRTADSGGLSYFVTHDESTNDRYYGLEMILASTEYLNGAQSW